MFAGEAGVDTAPYRRRLAEREGRHVRVFRIPVCPLLPYTLEELGHEFPPEVTEPLRLLTHDPPAPYRDYMDTLVVDSVARTVKRADLMHNLDETRFEGCGHIDEAKLARRRERYRVALEVLGEGEQFGLMLERRSVAAADMESARPAPLAGPVFEEICSMLDAPLPESAREHLAREGIWV